MFTSYDKLRPFTEIEACECKTVSGLLLVDLLTNNPIHCAVCRREVDPERISLSSDETEAIASWFSASNALYRLWLHSGEYENYAKGRLLDPNGQINTTGIEIARSLSAKLPTQLWFFISEVNWIGSSHFLAKNGKWSNRIRSLRSLRSTASLTWRVKN